MRHLTMMIAAIAVTAFVGGTAASAAQGDTYKAKKAECKTRAKTMSFGVHLVKKNRWVKDCIAGKAA
jgi:outer membrane lipoprotein SlyB